MRKTAERKNRRRWHLSWSALLIVLLVYAGVGTLLYPDIASWFYQYNQSQVIKKFTKEVEHVVPNAKEQLALAHQYNNSLRFGASVQAGHRLPTGNGLAQDRRFDYNSILKLDDEGRMGRIRVPASSVDLPIYHGTSDAVLLKGIGHLEGSSLPVGGPGTHAVLTGHRGLADALMFTNLDKVKVGDRFTLEVFGQVLVYQVNDVRVVEPDQTETLRIQAGKDLVTLITCTPLGINSHRILVTGERVFPTPKKNLDEAGKASGLPAFPWWAVIVGGVVVASGVFLWRTGLEPVRRRDDKRPGPPPYPPSSPYPPST